MEITCNDFSASAFSAAGTVRTSTRICWRRSRASFKDCEVSVDVPPPFALSRYSSISGRAVARESGNSAHSSLKVT